MGINKIVYICIYFSIRTSYIRCMKTRYIDLIEQSFDFPTEEFRLEDGELIFNEIPLMDIIKQYGTPLKISYLPKISKQISLARKWFNVAMAKVDYEGEYRYCYCTKSSHFSFILEEALKNDIHLETSSAFDINIIRELTASGLFKKGSYVISNGFKRPQYIENIALLINDGYENTIPVLDNKAELDQLASLTNKPFKLGIRIATEEEPKFQFYTSRLGMRYNNIVDFYESVIKNKPNVELSMLHFFINTGINDSAYYWSELHRAVELYCKLKKKCKTLSSLNIGGGFPIKDSLAFDYEYEYLAEEIIAQIKSTCNRNQVPEPDIFTEFGTFTVGESGATLFSVLQQKMQNDRERWNMVDSSFMTTLPDTWAINKRYILLPLNNWEDSYERVHLGGLTCDSEDFYNSEKHFNAVFMPWFREDRPLHIGFFHTGAYQETLGGFGGLQHCLIPGPKHVVVDREENGEISTRLFAKEQSYKSMLKILGY